jgi:tetraacyldisaccharide 4'-kinase
MVMRPPNFWQNPSVDQILPRLLQPASMLWRYAAKLQRRRIMPQRTPIPSLCIGNITVGGGGKTPTCLALARLMQSQGLSPAFGTRGYGGSLTQATCVDLAQHDAALVGDEALLLAARAPTYVGRNRYELALLAAQDGASHIIFDDGLQNPRLIYDRALLTIDGAYGLGNGRIMPAGPLRESLADAMQRCHAVILIGEDQHNLTPKLSPLKIFNARLDWDMTALDPTQPYYAFAGLARPEKFFTTCRSAGLELAGTRAFPDHHPYRPEDLIGLHQVALERRARLLTTAKDAVRLSVAWRQKVSVLPVEYHFVEPEVLSALWQN